MADINEAFGEAGKAWDIKRDEHTFKTSVDGRKKSLKEAFNIDYNTLQPHPKLKYTDDGCSHYISYKKLSPYTNTLGYDKHYVFNRSSATWSIDEKLYMD